MSVFGSLKRLLVLIDPSAEENMQSITDVIMLMVLLMNLKGNPTNFTLRLNNI